MSPESLATVIQTLALPDEEFFALDAAGTTALQGGVAKLVQGRAKPGPPGSAREPLPEVRAIGAPKQLDWRQRNTFPLLLGEVRSNRREWEVHALQNRGLAVSNLDTGSVGAIALDKGRRMPKAEPSGSGTPLDDFNAGLSSIGVRRYDLLQGFPRHLLQGHLAITFFDYDLASNTTLVHAWSTDDAASSGASLRDATRIAVLPALAGAGSAGVTLSVPARVSAGPAPLRAEVRLPRQRVTVIDAPPGDSHPLVLAASLLLVQLDRLQPVLLDLAAPAAPAGAGNVEAAFTLDLRGALAGRATAGDWLVYLVLGDTVTGPQALKIELP